MCRKNFFCRAKARHKYIGMMAGTRSTVSDLFFWFVGYGKRGIMGQGGTRPYL
jgi:hypothetical protein